MRWDLNKKSTPRPIYFNKNSTTRLLSQRLHPKSFVNPRHTSEVIDKKLRKDITLVNYFVKVSMIEKITLEYNPEKH